MDNLYTESMLRPMKKEQLLEIAAANEIKADKNIKNDDLIKMILEKVGKVPETSGNIGDPNGSNITPPENVDDADDGIPKFSKEQLLKSNWYSHRRDILRTLLEDDKLYSHAAVENIIGTFMKGKVN